MLDLVERVIVRGRQQYRIATDVQLSASKSSHHEPLDTLSASPQGRVTRKRRLTTYWHKCHSVTGQLLSNPRVLRGREQLRDVFHPTRDAVPHDLLRCSFAAKTLSRGIHSFTPLVPLTVFTKANLLGLRPTSSSMDSVVAR